MPRFTLIPTVIVAIVASRPADAAMMVHYDLAGLVLRSDAIVIADRTQTGTRPTRYHVVRSIRGSLAAGTDVDLDDSLYATTGHAIDTRVVVFFSRAPEGWSITSSGLRVTDGGKVYRFEQWNNPGGFEIVPQGRDPQDNWNADEAAIDLPTFERELDTAIHRVDALTAAENLTDVAKRRAAILAVLAPAGSSRPRMGFYVDELAERAATLLGKAGDTAGALEARLHDHSQIDRGANIAPLPELVATAQDATRSIALRRVAIQVIAHHPDYFANALTVKAMITLLADPSPAVRAPAATTAAQTWQWSSSDRKEDAAVKRLAREVRTAIAKQFATERDNQVLYAIVAAYDRSPLPSRKAGPTAIAHARVQRGAITVDVMCLRRGTRFAGGRLLATHDGTALELAATNLTFQCGDDNLGGGSVATVIPAGRYELAALLQVDRKPMTIALGSFTSDANGEITLAP